MSEKINNAQSLSEESATVKINFNEMDKADLLKMLAYMQSELEAREIVIGTLKSEKSKQMLYQAKYGQLNTAIISSTSLVAQTSYSNLPPSCEPVANDPLFLINDAFAALQRDSQYSQVSMPHSNGACVTISSNTDSSQNLETNLKPVYDNQLYQLENLISSQKKAQLKMKEQIIYLEKKCQKLSQALEDERHKHERDAAQGDDVLVMLEKERERLKSELEQERSHSRKLERELKRLNIVIDDQKVVIHNQRIAAAVIVKTKKQLESELKSASALNADSSTQFSSSKDDDNDGIVSSDANNENESSPLSVQNLQKSGSVHNESLINEMVVINTNPSPHHHHHHHGHHHQNHHYHQTNLKISTDKCVDSLERFKDIPVCSSVAATLGSGVTSMSGFSSSSSVLQSSTLVTTAIIKATLSDMPTSNRSVAGAASQQSVQVVKPLKQDCTGLNISKTPCTVEMTTQSTQINQNACSFSHSTYIKVSQRNSAAVTSSGTTNQNTTSVNTVVCSNTSITTVPKHPESLQWKTFDPKLINTSPSSIINQSQIPLSTKSPSNNRRQLPIVSSLPPPGDITSYYKSVSSTSSSPPIFTSVTTTTNTPITPYQKILSTPPPNTSIINQSAVNFHSSLAANYNLFNLHSSTSLTNPMVSVAQPSLSNSAMNYSQHLSTPSSSNVLNRHPNSFASQSHNSPMIISATSNTVNSSSSNASITNRLKTGPQIMPISSSNTQSSSIIRSGEASPSAPKHVYVNGK